MYLGEIIKNYREANSYSMQAFADKCGLSKGYIAMLEKNVNSKTGEPIAPSFGTFMKVAKAMGMSVAALLEMVDENQMISLSANDSEQLSNYARQSVEDEMMLDAYHNLSHEDRMRALAYMDLLKSGDLSKTDREFLDILSKYPDDKKSALLQMMKSFL